MLLDTTRAKIEAIFEWAREYFHLEYSSPILDQPEQAAVNLTESGSQARSGSAVATRVTLLRPFRDTVPADTSTG